MKSQVKRQDAKKDSLSSGNLQVHKEKSGNGISFQDSRSEFVSQLKNSSGGKVVIQRYAIVQPENLKGNEGASVESSELVRTEFGSKYVKRSSVINETGFNPEVTETITKSGSGKQQEKQSSLPAFKVSQKGMMALPAVGQARNFYTDASRIETANTIIKNNGGKIRLKGQGTGISVPRNPYEPDPKKMRGLQKVHAAIEKENDISHEIELQIQQVFPVMNCNDFIDLITGISVQGSRLAILETKGSPLSQKEIPAQETKEPVEEIATHLSEQGIKPKSRNPNSLVRKLNETQLDSNELIEGLDRYQQLSSGTKQARSEKYGINEFALPEVGEGLVIKTSPTSEFLKYKKSPIGPARLLDKGQKNNKTKQQEIRNSYSNLLSELDNAGLSIDKSYKDLSGRALYHLQTWGVHYAGVVARDGSDMVTLENYNRNTEIEWEHTRIFNNLFRKFKKFREHVARNVTSLEKAPDMDIIKELVDLALENPNLKREYNNALVEAAKSFETGLKKNDDTQRGNFYFQMYGPGKQSFHSEFEPLAVNPVTLRIRETTLPAKKYALDNCDEFRKLILKWESPILANALNGTAQTRLTKIINSARSEEMKARNLVNKGKTRNEYFKFHEMVSAAMQEFSDKMNAKVMGSYEHITGNAPVPVANNFTELSARCTAFLKTYYWFNSADDAYKNIVKLRTLCQALVNANL